MRSLLLASAALCMTAGVALAQTSTAPAPTGAPNGAMASPAPNASPGNMAPSNSMSGSGSSTAAGSSASGMSSNGPPQATSATGGMSSGSPSAAAGSTHYNGQDAISPPAGQASSAGGAMSNSGGGMSGMNMGSSSTKHVATMHTYASSSYHGTSGGGALPQNADPSAYLKIASKAIKQHNKMLADDALSHAETRMLDRAVPASTGATADNSPAVTAIEQARQALRSGDYQTAASDTRMAMHAHHGMMGGEGMNGANQSMNDDGASAGSAMTPMPGPTSGAGAMGASPGRPMGSSGAGIGVSGTGMGAGGSGPMGASGTGATGGPAQ